MKCLDTYALVEINKGNPRYAWLITEEFVITDLTMAEFYGLMYKTYNERTADYWHRKLSAFCRPVQRGTLLQAIRFRIDNKKQRLSFFDCAGYIFAREHNMLFVTGDRAFKQRAGVGFIR